MYQKSYVETNMSKPMFRSVVGVDVEKDASTSQVGHIATGQNPSGQKQTNRSEVEASTVAVSSGIVGTQLGQCQNKSMVSE